MGSLETIKKIVKRKATLMQIGGFKPDSNPAASWFGKVLRCLPSEDWPICKGKPMHALCQINLTQLPYVPESLSDLEFITIFVGPDDYPEWDDFSNMQIKDSNLELPEEIEENYWNHLNNVSGFKIGGWPTLIQNVKKFNF